MLVPSFAPVGSSGLYAPGGRLYRREPNSELAVDSRTYGDVTTLGLYEKGAKTISACAQSVRGAVLPIVLALAGADVTPADGKARDRKGTENLDPHAEFIRKALFEDLKPGFSRYLREAARTAIVNGHAVSEVVCRYDKTRRQTTLARLAPRPPWTIYRWLFTGGVLTGIVQRVYGGAQTFEPLPVDSLLVHTVEPSGDDPTGESWLRPCHMPIKLVLDGLKLLGIWMDREALGVPVANVEKGTTPADLLDIDEWLGNLRAHEGAFGRFRTGVEISWKQGNPDGGKAIADAIDFLKRDIRDAFLQGWQSAGTTPNGSLSASTAMQDPWVLAEEALAGDLLEPINTQLIPALITWNFGPQAAYPYIATPKLRSEDVAAALKPLIDAKTAGLTSGRSALERTHELLSLPAPEAEAAPVAAAVPGAAPAAEPVADVQESALNGAQVTALVAIVSQVAAGTLPRDAAVEIAKMAFQVDWPTADRLLGSAGKGFVPKVEEAPAPAAPPQTHSLTGCSCGTCEPLLMGEDPTKHAGVMVAFWPPSDVAAELAVAGGLPADELHLTLAYVGKEPGLGPKVLAAVEAWAKSAAPCEGELSGTGRFAATESSDGKDVLYLSFDAPTLPDLRQSLCAALDAASCGPKRNHGFTPHMTLSYVDPGQPDVGVRAERKPLRFAEIVVTVGEANTAFPLAGAPAAQLHSERAPWSARRPLLAGEGAVRFAEIGAKLDAAPADLQAGVAAALKAQRSSVTAWVAGLRKAAATGDFKAVNAADVPPEVRAALTDATAGYAAALYAFGREHAKAELDMAPGRAETAAKASQAAIREDIADPAPEPLTLAQDDDDSAAVPIEEPEDPALDSLARSQGDTIADEILRMTRALAIRDARWAEEAGLSPEEISEEKIWADFVASVEEAPAIKRTAMELSVEGNSAGRAAFMREAESEGVLYPVLYSALLDSGTCGPCREADGTIADSVAGADAGQIPASPNPQCESSKGRWLLCRCLRVLQPPQ